MKKFLFGFLVVAMLTPLMVCSMGSAMNPAKADTPPCHEQPVDIDDALMFMNDCMNIELQAASDGFLIGEPDQNVVFITFSWAENLSGYGFLPANRNIIRGPPEELLVQKTSLPVILTTQRFLI